MRVAEWSEESSRRGRAKLQEWRDRPRGIKPEECPPIETEFWVEIGKGGEKTKNPKPPRRTLLTMGGSNRVVILPSMELRSQRRTGTSQRTGRRRRAEVEETGSGHTLQRRKPPALLEIGLGTARAVSMDYWRWRHRRGIRPTEREWWGKMRPQGHQWR